jgi:hypothetical protein
MKGTQPGADRIWLVGWPITSTVYARTFCCFARELGGLLTWPTLCVCEDKRENNCTSLFPFRVSSSHSRARTRTHALSSSWTHQSSNIACTLYSNNTKVSRHNLSGHVPYCVPFYPGFQFTTF